MMDKETQLILSQMIQKQEFHGIPLGDIDSEFLEHLEESELRELYIVTVCVHLDAIDDLVNKKSIWKS